MNPVRLSVYKSSNTLYWHICSWGVVSTLSTPRRLSRELIRLIRGKLTSRYKNDPQIVAMTNLVAAYQDRNVQEAEKILRGEFDFEVDVAGLMGSK